jgi:hypothetical protein
VNIANRQCWIATRGLDPAVALDRFGLAPAARVSGDLPFRGVSVAGGALNGWFLLAFGDDAIGHFTPERFAAASRRCEMLVCERDVAVGAASCDRWFAGSLGWSVRHDPAHGDMDLRIEGPEEVPTYLGYLRKVAGREVGEGKLDAMREVPLRLALDETGFHPDRPLAVGVDLGLVVPPDRLESALATLPPPRPFWKFW